MNDPTDTAALIRQAERQQAAKERKTAVAQALAAALRDPQISSSSGFVAHLEQRKARRKLEKAQNPENTTNHADSITHASTPLETNREDY